LIAIWLTIKASGIIIDSSLGVLMNFKYILSIFLLISIVVVAGCIGQEEFKKNQPANFSIKSPANWENVDSDVTLKFSSENIKLIQPTGKNVLGEGHFHLFVDNSSYVIVSDNNYTFKELSPGVHVVKVELHNNDHSSTGVERSVMFTVSVDINSEMSKSDKSDIRDFEILSPSNFDNTPSDVTIKLLAKNFDVVQPSDKNGDKQGHFHLFLDNGSYIMVANINYTFYDLSPGQHIVRSTLHNNDHSSLGVEKSVVFVVIKSTFNSSVLVAGDKAYLDLKAAFDITPPGKNKDGEGHFHLFLDNQTYIPLATNSYVFTNLTSGKHTIRITANNNDHTPTGDERILTFNTPDFNINVSTNLTTANVHITPIDFDIVQPTGTLYSNKGHLRLYLDNKNYVQLYNSTYYEFTGLVSGKHILKVVLYNNDYSDSGVQKIVEFTTADKPFFNGSTLVSGSTVMLNLYPDFKVVLPGNNVDGEGHFHLFLDNGSYIMLASTNYTFYNLTSGQHTIRVTSNYNDHSQSGFERAYLLNVPDFTTLVTTDGYSKSATIKLMVTNFEIVAPKNTLESNKGHFHFFLDNGTYIPIASTTYIFNNLTSGTHTLRITMNNNDHTYTEIEKTIVFTV